MSKNASFFRLKRTKNHVKPPPKPHGVSVKIPHPRGFFKVNSPPPWGMGVGTPWGPRGVWGWGENPTCQHKTSHTGANPFINQPFDIIQKFFDRNGSYTLWIRKIRKIRKM